MDIRAEADMPWVDVDTAYPDVVSGSKTFQKWYSCVACGLRFKENETVLYRGKRYGTPCGCNRDIATLAQKGS